jgi:hypothetical protein
MRKRRRIYEVSQVKISDGVFWTEEIANARALRQE